MKHVSQHSSHRPFDLQRWRIQLGAAIGFWLLGIASSAHAHPGHSLKDATPGHIVTSPYHVVVLASVGFLIFPVSGCLQRRAARRRAQCAGIVVMAAALLLLP